MSINKRAAVEAVQKFHRNIRLIVAKMEEVNKMAEDTEALLENVEADVGDGKLLTSEQIQKLIEDTRHDWNVFCQKFSGASNFVEGIHMGFDSTEWTEV